MFDQLIQQFTSSRQGQTALSRLQQQGFAPHQANQFISAAVPAAAQSMHQAQSGGMLGNRPGGPGGLMDVGNSHYVTNFLSGAVSGLIRGEGMMGAAVDGLQGVAGGHVAQVIASRFGLPQRVAGTVGAIVTPLAIDFLWEKINGGGLNLRSLMGGGAGAAAGAATSGWGGGGGPGNMMRQMLGGGGAPAPQGGWGNAPAQQGGWGGAPQRGGFGGAPQGGGFGGQPANQPVSPTIQGGIGSILGGLFGGGN
ncbi:MAG: hypothetical protein AB8I08_15175 [Sandaracinaceae bacterium]